MSELASAKEPVAAGKAAPSRRDAPSTPDAARKTPPFPRRILLFAAVLFVINLGGAYLLDALGLVEGLLSPGGGRLVWLLPLGLVFYGARLLALFVAPGLVMASLALWALRRR